MPRHIQIIDQSVYEPWYVRVLNPALRALRLPPLTLKDPELARRLGWSGNSSAGVVVTEENMLGLSAIWAGVTLIASQVASLPLLTYRRDANGGKSRATDLRLYSLLHDSPNEEMTSISFRSTLTMHAIVWGNAYAEIQRDQVGRPYAFWPIHPSRVRAARDADGELYYEVRHADGHIVRIESYYMLALVGPSADGIVGYNLSDVGRESLAVAKAMQTFAASFFANGATTGGFLTTPNKLTPEARQNVRASLEQRHQGPQRAHSLALLEEGFTYTPNSTDPEKGQLNEGRTFELGEVARWLNIPPHKLRDLSRSSFNNIENEQLSWLSDTLMPWLKRWEEELTRKCVSRTYQPTIVIEHLVEGLLRADTATRGNYYTQAIRGGWMAINEVRVRENLNPLPGGDELLVARDLMPLRFATQEPVQPGPDDARMIGDGDTRIVICSETPLEHEAREIRQEARLLKAAEDEEARKRRIAADMARRQARLDQVKAEIDADAERVKKREAERRARERKAAEDAAALRRVYAYAEERRRRREAQGLVV